MQSYTKANKKITCIGNKNVECHNYLIGKVSHSHEMHTCLCIIPWSPFACFLPLDIKKYILLLPYGLGSRNRSSPPKTCKDENKHTCLCINPWSPFACFFDDKFSVYSQSNSNSLQHNILYIKANMVFVRPSVWTKIGQCLEDSSNHCPFPVELVCSRL